MKRRNKILKQRNKILKQRKNKLKRRFIQAFFQTSKSPTINYFPSVTLYHCNKHLYMLHVTLFTS